MLYYMHLKKFCRNACLQFCVSHKCESLIKFKSVLYYVLCMQWLIYFHTYVIKFRLDNLHSGKLKSWKENVENYAISYKKISVLNNNNKNLNTNSLVHKFYLLGRLVMINKYLFIFKSLLYRIFNTFTHYLNTLLIFNNYY